MSLEHQEEEECLVLMDQQVLKVKLETEVEWDHQDPRVKLEIWEGLAHQVFKVSEDLPEDMVQEELWVHQEKLENLAKMERMENLDLRDFKACLVQWELLETKDLWVNKVNKVILEFLDLRDLEEIQERMVFQETMAHLVRQVLQVTEGHQEVLGQGASRVCLVHQGRMEWLEKMEKLDCKDLQV